MFKKYLYIFFIIIFFSVSLSAEVRIYLLPKVEISNDDVRLLDIAKVYGSGNDVISLNEIKISKDIYSDGFIEKSELLKIFKKNLNYSVIIYGSAVKIKFAANENIDKIGKPGFLVKKGDIIFFVVNNRGIRIEVKGVAMKNGRLGEVIQVKLKNRVRVRGKVINSKTVVRGL